ncbi:DUF4166 domain-containing protein [Microbacterium sp. M3]|uniref:DUF4166 domain-containing protein n=1 Tax=Microbacterium arthrosphaerae TaxID=792652 RepID=A0ABU4H276_9MICO|nr:MULTISPECIES: DUF4166 domain-containing protein [Microbacterium]MDW4573444.1 DUF4166 domain-containing protein [Microbacterium arthrosphaerae]MDW7607299.1 DUF4166 domain-containing protein [Microbacterium sp. M3]
MTAAVAASTSVFARAMGTDFGRLHPMLQRRFGVGLDAGYACIGRGTMSRIRRGPWWTIPFLQNGRFRNILVPEVGVGVPFVIENYPYRDPLGRETVTFVRTFSMPRARRRFDATMILDDDGRVLDYLGSHQHLAVDLDLSAEPDGSLLLRSGEQRFYEGPLGFRFPMLFSGRAELRESFDDEAGVFRIRLEVRNRVFGFLFGYEGEFRCEFPAASDAPARLKPVRHESRT